MSSTCRRSRCGGDHPMRPDVLDAFIDLRVAELRLLAAWTFVHAHRSTAVQPDRLRLWPSALSSHGPGGDGAHTDDRP